MSDRERGEEKEEKERGGRVGKVFHLQDGCNGQGWARLEPAIRGFSPTSHVGTGASQGAAKPKLGQRSFLWVPRDLGHPLQFPQGAGLEAEQSGHELVSIWMLALQSAVSLAMPQRWPHSIWI